MRWHWLIGLTVVGVVTAAGGCRSDTALLAADPNLLDLIAHTGRGDDEALSRAQKPEGKWAIKEPAPLNQRPERPHEIAELPAAARIHVTVNGEVILNEEIVASCLAQLKNAEITIADPQQRIKAQGEIFIAARDQLIDREVVLQEAFSKLSSTNNKAGQKFLEKLKEVAGKEFEKNWLKPNRERTKVSTDEEFKAYLATVGISLEMTRRQWERQFMAMEYLRNKIFFQIDNIGHTDIVEYYESHPEEFQLTDEVEWQDLFIRADKHPTRDAARRFAEVLASRIRMGEDFAALVKEFDDGTSNKETGAGFGTKRSEIPPEIGSVLFNLHDGEMGPVVEIPTGFHIVRVVKRTYAGKKPFDEKVQKQIKDKLRNEIGNREMKYIVAELRRKAVIEYSSAAD